MATREENFPVTLSRLARFVIRVKFRSKHVRYWPWVGTSFAHYTIQLRLDWYTPTVAVLLSSWLALFGDNAFPWTPPGSIRSASFVADSLTVTIPRLLNRSPCSLHEFAPSKFDRRSQPACPLLGNNRSKIRVSGNIVSVVGNARFRSYKRSSGKWISARKN